MRVVSLGSGSSGNALLIQHEGTNLLLDIGLSCRDLRIRLASFGIEDHSLTAILLSHEHYDHIRGLARFLHYQPCPVLATAGTLHALDPGPGFRHERIVPGQSLDVGKLTIIPIAVSHDALEPVGFVISDGEATIAVFTDLGTVDRGVYEALCAAQLVILEANYDSHLLERGSYPWPLKRRIKSSHGHLSNEECAATLARLNLGPVREIWLAHLSAENNTPQHALQTVRTALGHSHDLLAIRALPRRGAPVFWDSTALDKRGHQMRLF